MFTVERNDISANLQWYSINGTSGLKQVTIFSILTPVILRDQLWNQHIKVVPGAIFYVSGLKKPTERSKAKEKSTVDHTAEEQKAYEYVLPRAKTINNHKHVLAIQHVKDSNSIIPDSTRYKSNFILWYYITFQDR